MIQKISRRALAPVKHKHHTQGTGASAHRLMGLQ